MENPQPQVVQSALQVLYSMDGCHSIQVYSANGYTG